MDNRNSRAGYPGMDADELARLQRLTGGSLSPGDTMAPPPASMGGQAANSAPAPDSSPMGINPSAILGEFAPGQTGNAPGTNMMAGNAGMGQPMEPTSGMLPMAQMFPMNGMLRMPADMPAVSAAPPAANSGLANQPAVRRATPAPVSAASAAAPGGAANASAGVSASDDDMQNFMAQGYLMGPNCFGRDARIYAEKLMEYINDEYRDYITYLALARKAPSARARTILRSIARDEMRHARRWAAAYFLITGKTYFPQRGSMEAPPIASYSQALRERYLAESQDAVKYRQFARETTDRCLRRIAMETSDDERQHAQHILELIQDRYR